jgi:hypothetical protein
MKRFILLSLLSGFLFSYPVYAKDKTLQTLEYNCSSDSFPKERKILKEKYKELYADRDELAEAAEEGGEAISLKNGDFCITKTDLNQDGVDDVLLYSSFGSLTCGTLGCQTKAFFIDRDGEWNEVLSLHAQKSAVSLAEIYKDYRVLVIQMKVSCPCNKIVRPDGVEILDNTADRIFVYDEKKKEYRGIGVGTE